MTPVTYSILVGLLDSQLSHELAPQVTEARSFDSDGTVVVKRNTSSEDCSGHGTTLARVILEHAPRAKIAHAQVFSSSGMTTAAAAAAGLNWVVKRGVRLVNMSFGLRQDRDVLRKACRHALESEVILVGSTPARGQPVFPSYYPGVIRITGDARCAPSEISDLDRLQADFGACCRAQGSPIAGASLASAHASGILAAFLARSPSSTTDDACAYLRECAVYHGSERRLFA